MTDYIYSIQNDFPNHIVNTTSLLTSITSSAIVTALDNIASQGDVVTITFKASLSNDDETILNGIVAAHTGEASPNDPLAVNIVADDSVLKDSVGKIITNDQQFAGPLYHVACRFTTGKGSDDPSWKPPVNEPGPWTIDVTGVSGYTVVDYHPTQDIQIDGCGLKLLQTAPSGELVIESLTLAPNIPEIYGGNHVFAENFEFCKDFDEHSRYTAPKYLRYLSGTPEANRIRIKIKHDPNENIKMQVFLGTYKPLVG